jgi:tRNA (guanine26-N2/guanine27-N2)-dimethyltransferase
MATNQTLCKSKSHNGLGISNSLKEIVTEEGVTIYSYGEKITKELDVFYNPVMKINRDISLLFIKAYFSTQNQKKIKFCDPMTATGIRELRFLKTIPEIFEKITMGDINGEAIENIKNNFKNNNLDPNAENIELNRDDAINTISRQFYDFIEIDPFGSPVPFLDMAIQRVKHNGILSVTATDTAALCGTYPKRTLRKYGMKVQKLLCYEEIGLRNLIAHCQIQAAKYDKILIPQITFSFEHFYKIFFKVQDSKSIATENIKDLRYFEYDKSSQKITLNKYESEDTVIGKTYAGLLQNKDQLQEMINNLNLIKDKKKIEKLLNKLNDEGDEIGYYNLHKIEKENNISSNMKFADTIKELQNRGFNASFPHCGKLCIKTNATSQDILEVLKTSLNTK